MHSHRRTSRPLYDEPPRAHTRCCDHPGCAQAGEYRAPKSRSQLNEYYWFCLDHVRDYNKSWDYYAGMSTAEIEREMRQDTTWQRPSWPLGKWATQDRFLRDRVVKGFGFEFGRESAGAADGEAETRRRPAPTPEMEALAVLNLTPPVDFAHIKARYRELAKQHHPDINGGAREAEEKLKEINHAYNTLKACYGV